jgi:heme oxygenase
MSLKELTHEAHKNAETQPFVKILFSGSIDPKLYAIYLKNQHPQYEILEACAMAQGLLTGLPDIRRAPAILADYLELHGETELEPKTLPIVKRYMDYIISIKDEPHRLMSHLYVRHMGDLAGGQMIAKRVPGRGKYYQFENPDVLKAAIRERLSDDMVDEALVCFAFAADFFKEMMTQVETVDE